MLSTTMVPSVTTDVSRVDELNMLNIVERKEFISLIRENFGAPSLFPRCGLQMDRKVHGNHQDTLRCLGCENFNLRIICNKDGCWQIVKNSSVEHWTDDLVNNVATPCEVGNAQCNKCIVTVVDQTKNVGKRIHSKMNGCSSEHLRILERVITDDKTIFVYNGCTQHPL